MPLPPRNKALLRDYEPPLSPLDCDETCWISPPFFGFQRRVFHPSKDDDFLPPAIFHVFFSPKSSNRKLSGGNKIQPNRETYSGEGILNELEVGK